MLTRRFFSASVIGSAASYTALRDLAKPKGAPAELPKLDFDYTQGVAPVLSPRQVELHYTKHHKAYVDKFNTLAGDKFDGLTFEEVMDKLVDNAESKVLFNQAAQHFNHSFYWKCLTPHGNTMPKELEESLAKTFGSVNDFKKKFEDSGAANFGSGWTWLVYDTKDKQLKIVNTGNAACPTTSGQRPLFTIDVWEHAYYKDFENKRPDYLKEIWNVVNWEFVASNLTRATTEA